MILVVIVAIVGSAWLGFTVAEAKGLQSVSWALACILFGPIGLIALAGMPDRRLRAYMKYLAEEKGWESNVDYQVQEPAKIQVGSGPDEDFRIASRLYRKVGGVGEPDRNTSNISSQSIELKDSRGKLLAYLANKNGFWVVCF